VFEGLLTPTHLVIILAIALVVLGPKRLPEAGRSLGAAPESSRPHRAAPRAERVEDRVGIAARACHARWTEKPVES
jgi:TatA/E family protein of Tat protein translocase